MAAAPTPPPSYRTSASTPPPLYRASAPPYSNYTPVPCDVSHASGAPKGTKDLYLKIAFAVVVGVAVVAISALIYGYVDAMRQVREAQNASRDLWREAWDARKETWQAQDDSRAAQEKAEQLAKKVAEVQEEAMQAQGEVESLQEKVVQAQKEALQTRKQWRQTKAEAAQIFGKVSRAKLDLQMAESECDHAHDVVDGVLADLAKLREKLDESKLDHSAASLSNGASPVLPPGWTKFLVLVVPSLLYAL
ncbi:moesin isoform X2 [Penaeus vannamei]|uniref:moesin isoform X2 n=1 Tax=Penaeus vannamei TaxID=6689 RepID=UPI00387F7BF8